jgi:hypothetical protein
MKDEIEVLGGTTFKMKFDWRDWFSEFGWLELEGRALETWRNKYSK